MISTAQYSLTTATTLIVPDTSNAEEVHIHVLSGNLYIGNSDVTTTTGLRLDNGDKKILSNHAGPIYATATTTASIAVMVIER